MCTGLLRESGGFLLSRNLCGSEFTNEVAAQPDAYAFAPPGQRPKRRAACDNGMTELNAECPRLAHFLVLEDGIRDALALLNVRYIETITDKDRLDTYKLFPLRCEGMG